MINHLVFQGRFTKTPELKTSPNDGTKYVNFTLVWSEKNKNDKEMTCFIDCVAFAGLAEFITKYFEKGDMCIVEGKLLTRKYEDAEGKKKSKNELKVNKCHFCGYKKTDDVTELFKDD